MANIWYILFASLFAIDMIYLWWHHSWYILFASLFAINMIYLWWLGVRVFLKKDYENRLKRLMKQIKEIWSRKT